MDHPNVKKEFFQAVIDWCSERGIYLVAVFSTTGHAKAYTAAHPELAICDGEGKPEDDSGIMCHRKEAARTYAAAVIEECLARYRGFHGAILHPPEFSTLAFALPVKRNTWRGMGGACLRPLTRRQSASS
jgi:hypothetical protein